MPTTESHATFGAMANYNAGTAVTYTCDDGWWVSSGTDTFMKTCTLAADKLSVSWMGTGTCARKYVARV